MFRFDKEQVVFDFAGVKMGGQPGEYPTVLAGTIFYGGHNIISDELTGDFDKSRAETLVNDMVEMSDVTGNPCIVQVFGQTEEAIVKYIEYIGDICDKPFLIDSTSGDARVAGAQYADGGIDKFMMDTAVTPLGQGAGIAAKTTFAEKAKWGYPVGSGIHNVPSAWDWLRDYKKAGNKTAYTVCDIGANIVQVMTGGDFVLFGPIDNAKIAFPAVAQTDMFIAEAAADFGTEAVEDHPINKLV